MRKWLEPHKINLSSIKVEKIGDFLWGAGFILIVSGKVVNCYHENNLSGIKKIYQPTEIINIARIKRSESNEQIVFHLVDIKWDGASIDDTLTNVIRKPIKCSYCRGDINSVENIVIEECF